MTHRRSLFILFLGLVLSVSFVVPAEDVFETAYDESESLPFESTSVFSVSRPETIAQAPAAGICASWARPINLRHGAQGLDHVTGWANPISDSLTILDRSLRC